MLTQPPTPDSAWVHFARSRRGVPLPGPHDTARAYRASQSDETGSGPHAAALSAEMWVRVMEHASSFLHRAWKPPKGRLLPSPGAVSLTSSVSEWKREPGEDAKLEVIIKTESR